MIDDERAPLWQSCLIVAGGVLVGWAIVGLAIWSFIRWLAG